MSGGSDKPKRKANPTFIAMVALKNALMKKKGLKMIEAAKEAKKLCEQAMKGNPSMSKEEGYKIALKKLN